MVPDRLSYSEMAMDEFKYPSNWTESWNHYVANRKEVCDKIVEYMENYNKYIPLVHKQMEVLRDNFFSARGLLNNIKR